MWLNAVREQTDQVTDHFNMSQAVVFTTVTTGPWQVCLFTLAIDYDLIECILFEESPGP